MIKINDVDIQMEDTHIMKRENGEKGVRYG